MLMTHQLDENERNRFSEQFDDEEACYSRPNAQMQTSNSVDHFLHQVTYSIHTRTQYSL